MMRSHKIVVSLALAILTIVVVISGCGPKANSANANAANNPLDPALVDAHMVANAPGYHANQYGSLAFNFVLDILMIVSGFGLLQYKKWARTMAIAYAVLSLIFKVATLAYQTLVFIPAMTSFYEQALLKGGQAPPGFAIGLKASPYLGVCSIVLFAAYPIVVLSILMSKTGKAAFDYVPSRDDGYDDDDEYDDRRERFDDRDRPRRDDDRFGEHDDRGRR